MQTKVQGTGSEALKSSVKSAPEIFSSLRQTAQRPFRARPLKDQPYEMKCPGLPQWLTGPRFIWIHFLSNDPEVTYFYLQARYQ